MDLSTSNAPKTRTVIPFPDHDPDFSVELRKLEPEEIAQICDHHGYNDAKGRTAVKLQKVVASTVKKAVIRVNGATDNGVPMEPEAVETKLRLLKVKVETADGEVSLYDYCNVLAKEQEQAEAKNLPRV